MYFRIRIIHCHQTHSFPFSLARRFVTIIIINGQFHFLLRPFDTGRIVQQPWKSLLVTWSPVGVYLFYWTLESIKRQLDKWPYNRVDHLVDWHFDHRILVSIMKFIAISKSSTPSSTTIATFIYEKGSQDDGRAPYYRGVYPLLSKCPQYPYYIIPSVNLSVIM